MTLQSSRNCCRFIVLEVQDEKTKGWQARVARAVNASAGLH